SSTPGIFCIAIEASDQLGHTPPNALQPVRIEGNTLRNNQLHLLVFSGDNAEIVNNTIAGTTPCERPTGIGLTGKNVLLAGNTIAFLPTAIALLGDDPVFGTMYGVTANPRLANNLFCQNLTNIVVEPLVAGVVEEGTVACLAAAPPPLTSTSSVILS